MIRGYAAKSPGAVLEAFEYDPGPLAPGYVEIDVISCGVCHSDISMIDNEWGASQYPIIPGHEVIGRVSEVGGSVSEVELGQLVGLGWFSKSCMSCRECLGGDHNLCMNDAEATIIGRHGGFSDKVRCQSTWAIPLPEGLDLKKAGPLFCGGITVFNPIVQNNIRPTARVGVIGVGGLGHLALQFLNKWGCEVIAFSSSESKKTEALSLGAHSVVDSRNAEEIKKIERSLDLIISTVNVPLEWDLYLSALAPKGKLHLVGATLEPIPVSAFSLIGAQLGVSGSPLGSPATTSEMLGFCARHGIEPVTEHFPMSKVNDALQHLRDGKARYRIVLENDWN